MTSRDKAFSFLKNVAIIAGLITAKKLYDDSHSNIIDSKYEIILQKRLKIAIGKNQADIKARVEVAAVKVQIAENRYKPEW